jgi:hypothetical protein
VNDEKTLRWQSGHSGARQFYDRMKGYELLLEENKRLTFEQMIYTLVLKLPEKSISSG